jgi:hypothetical protein
MRGHRKHANMHSQVCAGACAGACTFATRWPAATSRVGVLLRAWLPVGMQTCMHACMHVDVIARMRVGRHACMHVDVIACMRVCVYALVFACMRVFVCCARGVRMHAHERISGLRREHACMCVSASSVCDCARGTWWRVRGHAHVMAWSRVRAFVWCVPA